MKYKILITGNNKSTIDDVFKYLCDDFELQNCSTRFDDILCHIKYYKPHIFLYCMHNETYETMQRIIALKRDKGHHKVPFAIVASKEACEELRKMSVSVADLELEKPITVSQIADRITNYLERNFVNPQNESEEASAYAPYNKPVTADQALFNELDSLFAAKPIPDASSAPGAQKQVQDLDVFFKQANASENRRRHILVVDDDFRMLKLIKRYLDDTYDIATAVNGKVALKFLQTKMTDLILLDYEMPEENGPAVLEKLRANPFTSNIPVIFLTGINDSKKIMQVLSLKPQGYLLKPIDREKLVSEIQKVIG